MLYALLSWNTPNLIGVSSFDLNPLKHILSRYLNKLKICIINIHNIVSLSKDQYKLGKGIRGLHYPVNKVAGR